jgi:hypothetical protein
MNSKAEVKVSGTDLDLSLKLNLILKSLAGLEDRPLQ